ncbi:MAG: penicillin-binding protein [Bacilli bacterium]|nr:penicillin-binding protein [Bacilli bacterium]
MKTGKDMINRIRINKLIFIIPFLFFLTVIIQMTQLSLSTKVDGINLKEFANNRNTKKEILYANRGTIYTSNGDILAQNIDSYTVIAYLSPKRSEGSKKPKHVVDKEATAKSLSPVLNMSEELLLKLLNRKNLYQVELRPGGYGITELKKEEIEKLQLAGIDFIKTFKRYYPNNDFLSYTLGYVQIADDLKITGEMGIEKFYNKELSGEDGYLEYQKDLNGYRIPNIPEIRREQKDGMDIYLTIDDNIQMFTERVVKEAATKYKPDWMLITIADAKTGKILGTASSPSFNPNIKNIESYLNPLVSYAYEPGSTMKTYAYMAAMEKGTYDGKATFKSGKLTVGDDVISDWNKGKGWGTITFDRGYTLSSNVGVANMIDKFITRNDLKVYYDKLGFGKTTNFTLPSEAAGTINFKYKIEVANAAFGQGITTTPIQHIQALTSISNNGVMLKPYIVDKIINPNTNEIVFQGTKEELGRVASTTTVNKIKNLMYDVVNGDSSIATGTAYKIDGYDIIGKTGTAQYVNPITKKYYTSSIEVIKSFAGMFPKDDPQIVIYAITKRPVYNSDVSLTIPVKKLINDIAKYLNIKQHTTKHTVGEINYEVPNFINKDISVIDSNYKTVILGDGNKIIDQYPKKGTTISSADKIFIVTNSKNIKLPRLIKWSGRDVNIYCNLVNIKCNVEGYGFVYKQNVATGTSIDSIEELNVILKRTNSKVEVGN